MQATCNHTHDDRKSVRWIGEDETAMRRVPVVVQSPMWSCTVFLPDQTCGVRIRGRNRHAGGARIRKNPGFPEQKDEKLGVTIFPNTYSFGSEASRFSPLGALLVAGCRKSAFYGPKATLVGAIWNFSFFRNRTGLGFGSAWRGIPRRSVEQVRIQSKRV